MAREKGRCRGVLPMAGLFLLCCLFCWSCHKKPPMNEEMEPGSGQGTFALACGSCHDDDAQGDGPQHADLRPGPANLTLVRDSPAMFSSIVKNGIPGTAMPPFPLGDKTVDEISKFVASQPQDTTSEWDRPWGLGDAPPDAASGEKLFLTACSGCHGGKGDGKGPWAAGDRRIWPKPADLQGQSSDIGRLYRIITDGREGTMMGPNRGRLPDKARWDLAGYVNSLFSDLSRSEIQDHAGRIPTLKNPYTKNDRDVGERGRNTFDLYCASCHNTQARGSFLAPRLNDRIWALGMGKDTELYFIIEKGMPGSLMPPHPQFNEEEFWDVITYLRNRGGKPDPWVDLGKKEKIPANLWRRISGH